MHSKWAHNTGHWKKLYCWAQFVPSCVCHCWGYQRSWISSITSCCCSCCHHHVAIYPAGVCVAAHRAPFRLVSIALALVLGRIMLALMPVSIMPASVVMLVLNSIGSAGVGAGVHIAMNHTGIRSCAGTQWYCWGLLWLFTSYWGWSWCIC